MSERDRSPLPLRFDADGLAPVVIQEATTNAVLMVAFMNAAALAATRATGRVHFWSRSRHKLWRKGETSGHEQIVREIYVNCDRNSLLITVDQVGAVCHDGYATCYYRRLQPDNQLTIAHRRVFDPADVYPGVACEPDGTPARQEARTPPSVATDPHLSTLAAEHYAAFARLRDEDLMAESRTSALLRDPAASIAPRVADELRELAGALDGSHTHQNQRADVALEAGQVIYWVTIAALQRRVPWSVLRSDRALATVTTELPPDLLPRMLRQDAATWADGAASADLAAQAHATLALVGQAVATLGIAPADILAADLAALRAKPYFTIATSR